MRNDAIIVCCVMLLFFGCQHEPGPAGITQKREHGAVKCEEVEGIFLHPDINLMHLADFKSKFHLKLKIEADALKKSFAAVIEENGSQAHRFLRIFPSLGALSAERLKNNPSFIEITKNCPKVDLEPFLGKDNENFILKSKPDIIGFLRVKNPFDESLKEGSDYYPFLITQSINKTKVDAVSLTENWDTPFQIAMNRLAKNDWEKHSSASLTDFKNTTEKLWKELLKKRIPWKEPLDPAASDDYVNNARDNLAKNEHIKKVFYTKPATLVFQATHQPFIIIKMDNRTPDVFSPMERGYYSAYEKTKAVQKTVPGQQLDHLFLPLEAAGVIKKPETKIVFSETIPLFSEAEIDNRVLLHMLIARAEKDKTLHKELTTLFEQVVRYICRVDFDDVNYRNIVFAIDGRLAPFDTDSGLARTGVHTFLTTFFAYKFLTKAQVLALIQSDCAVGSYQNNPNNIVQLYANTSREDARFDNDKTAIDNIIDFLSFKNIDDTKVSSMEDLDKKYGKFVENVLNKNIKNRDKKTHLFGRRCEDVVLIVDQIQNEIFKASEGALSKNQAVEKTEIILEEARKQGKIFASGPINSLGKSITYGIIDFICF